MTSATTPSTVQRTIVETLATMASAPGEIALDARLRELDIDSLDLVELAQVIEDECGVSLELGQLRGLETVRAVVVAFGAPGR